MVQLIKNGWPYPLCIAIECKLRVNIELLTRAQERDPYANYAYDAVVPGCAMACESKAKIFTACGARLIGLDEIGSSRPITRGTVNCWVPMNRCAKVKVWELFLRSEYRASANAAAGRNCPPYS